MPTDARFETLLFEIRDSIATITLNRPEVGNAIDLTMAQELFDAAHLCLDNGVRAVVMTGAGKMFCAGGDLKSLDEAGDDRPRLVSKIATLLHLAQTRLAYLDAPVVMAINGAAAGGGFSLSISGDYSIAAAGAKFVPAYLAAGLSPDGTGTYHLAKHIGLARAKELFLTNRTLTAEEACDWGLINRVVPADDLESAATEMARRFAEGPTAAFGETKRLLLTAYADTLETQIEKETQGIADRMRSSDGQNGLKAFLAREKPSFKGK